jgi:hypothetical protein
MLSVMSNNILDITCEQVANISRAVALWNYWDHEHLDTVHEGYKKSDIMYENTNFMFRVDKVSVPVPFIRLTTPIFQVQHDAETMYTFAVQFGVTSKTTIKIEEIKPNKCKFIMRYQFDLSGWRIILKPILKKLIPIWNQRVWNEDLPVKLRRQKVLEYNFKDFSGLPKKIEDRVNVGPFETKLPVPRPKTSNRDQHPFKLLGDH